MELQTRVGPGFDHDFILLPTRPGPGLFLQTRSYAFCNFVVFIIFLFTRFVQHFGPNLTFEFPWESDLILRGFFSGQDSWSKLVKMFYSLD